MKKDNAIKRAARWVARMFGYKAENKFARSLWYVFATSATVVVLIMAGTLIVNVIDSLGDQYSSAKNKRQENNPIYLHDNNNEYISPNVIYHDGYTSYLYNTVDGRRTVTDVRWICESSDGDSLAVCCIGGKRGYVNRYTGKMAIQNQYDKAWIFSEGMACVMKGWRMTIIDHQGKPVFDQTFPYNEGIESYCFHNGLCPMSNGGGKNGLINKRGEWAVEPVYSYIEYKKQGFWWVWDDEGNEGLLDLEGKTFLPIAFSNLHINEENGRIYASNLNHKDQVYDFDGNLVNDCSFEEIELMEYESDEYMYSDVYEMFVRKTMAAGLSKYRTSDYHYGLIDKNGNTITPPLYVSISAMGPNRYYCDGPQGVVVLNEKGQECREKL